MSGRLFSAEEAQAGGLVSEVLAPQDLLPRAQEMALEIAQNTSAVSVAMTRQMMWQMLGASHPMEAHRIDSRGMQQMGQMADAREGIQSFLQKQGYKTDRTPKGPPGKVLNKKQISLIKEQH